MFKNTSGSGSIPGSKKNMYILMLVLYAKRFVHTYHSMLVTEKLTVVKRKYN